MVVLLQFVLFQKQVISTSTGMFQKYRGLFGVDHSFFTEPFISSSSQESAHNFYKRREKEIVELLNHGLYNSGNAYTDVS